MKRPVIGWLFAALAWAGVGEAQGPPEVPPYLAEVRRLTGNQALTVAELEYTLTGPMKVFAFRPLSSNPAVSGRVTVPNPAGHRWRVEVGGRVVSETSTAEVTATFDLNDTVVMRRVE